MKNECFRKSLNFWMGRKKIEEANLKKTLKENVSENISHCIGFLCMIMVNIEYWKLNVESKPIEGLGYVSNASNYKKAEREVRAKFNVPRTVPLKFK